MFGRYSPCRRDRHVYLEGRLEGDALPLYPAPHVQNDVLHVPRLLGRQPDRSRRRRCRGVMYAKVSLAFLFWSVVSLADAFDVWRDVSGKGVDGFCVSMLSSARNLHELAVKGRFTPNSVNHRCRNQNIITAGICRPRQRNVDKQHQPQRRHHRRTPPWGGKDSASSGPGARPLRVPGAFLRRRDSYAQPPSERCQVDEPVHLKATTGTAR